jgi:hypothetical protein
MHLELEVRIFLKRNSNESDYIMILYYLVNEEAPTRQITANPTPVQASTLPKLPPRDPPPPPPSSASSTG